MSVQTFKFQRSDFRIEAVGLKSLSKATIDPQVVYIDSTGETIRKSIPTSIARLVKNKLHNVTKFFEPYPAYLAFVDDRIVAMDVAVEKDYVMFQEFGEWISILEKRESIIDGIGENWLWDGQYAYEAVGDVIPAGTDGFGVQQYRAVNLYRLGEERTNITEELGGFAFKDPSTGEWVRTGPVTRMAGGYIQIAGTSEKSSTKDLFLDAAEQFKKLDNKAFVNLRFVNYAAKSLTNQFDYSVVEPLGLPLLMIEHRTFNLGGLTVPVQMTSPAPIKFSQAIAWLVGLHKKIATLDDVVTLKQTFKMLLSKGNTMERFMGDEKADPTANQMTTKEAIAALREKMSSAALVNFSE